MLNVVLLHSSSSNCIKSYGARCLYPVGRSTVIDKQIDVLNSIFKNPNIIIVAGYKFGKVKTHVNSYKNVLVVENCHFETTNDLYSLELGIKHLTNNVLVIQDNLIITKTLFNKFKSTQSQLFISKNQKFEIGTILQENIVKNTAWGLTNYWTNISYYCNNEFNLLSNIIVKEKTKKWFIMEAINLIIEKEGRFSSNFIKGNISLIDKFI